MVAGEGVMFASGENKWKERGGCISVPNTNKGRNYPHPVNYVGSYGGWGWGGNET